MIDNLTAREKKILETITDDQSIGVAELSRRLGVSTVTVRTDLNGLADKGVIVRNWGGATPAFHPAVLERQKTSVEEKKRIARAAAEMVRDGDTIMVEAGTTTALMVKYLFGKRDISIVTNSLLVVPYARANPALILTLIGGEFRPASESLVGAVALAQLERFHVRYAFVGTDGFSPNTGLTTHLVEGGEIVKKMAAQAETTIVLADSGKYGKTGFVSVLPLGGVDHIITDTGLSDRIAEIEETGVRVTAV